MSDLRHRTPEDLRKLIAWCERKRSEHDDERAHKRKLVERLEAEIAEHGKAINNIGQKEGWARTWLARKELGMEASDGN